MTKGDSRYIVGEKPSRPPVITKRNLIGIALGTLAVVLCLVWFDWKLLLVMWLAMWGNNLERSK